MRCPELACRASHRRAGRRLQLAVSYANAFGQDETGGTAMTFDLILIGLAIAFDPIPLTTFMVVLPSKRGVRKGAAFVFGWLVSLAIVVTATILATGNNPPKSNTAPSIASLAVKIALGVFLVWTGVRRERRRGQPKEPKKTPKWQQQVDSMS